LIQHFKRKMATLFKLQNIVCRFVLPKTNRLSIHRNLIQKSENDPSTVEREQAHRVSYLNSHFKNKHICLSPRSENKIPQLLSMFPFSQEHIETAIKKEPRLLQYDPEKFFKITQVLVECGDYDIFYQEDAIQFISGYPDILEVDVESFREKISSIFSATVEYEIPWEVVLRDSPQTLMYDTKTISRFLGYLEEEFGTSNVGFVLLNNPDIIGMKISTIKKTIDYLIETMSVSPFRICRSPNVLTCDLEFLQLRYEFVLRSGHYRHPDPGARSAKPEEASPLPHLLLEPSVSRFVAKATPGLSMEEFYVFTALFEEEKLADRTKFDEFGFEDNSEELDEEIEEFRASFKGKRKKRKQSEDEKKPKSTNLIK